MPFAVVGLSHRTAPVEVRERFAFHPSEAPDALRSLLDKPGVGEAALISTCNRTELYLHLLEAEQGVAHAKQVLASQAGELSEPAERFLYVRREKDVVRHLFRVVSGLDSMVLGEVQIQGQVRDAYEAARSLTHTHPAVGAALNRLFQKALAIGSRVRAETRIAEGAASVPSAAVELARKIFGSLRGRRGMVLGAGEMGELTLQCLVNEGLESLIVASRDLTRARKLAEDLRGSAVPYREFLDHLQDVDILITSTGAPHPVVTHAQFRRTMVDEPRSPLFVIDIAVPRDVEPAVGDLPNVFLYSIDDLEHVVTANLERRRAEIPRAEELVEEAAADFWRWYSGLRAVPVLKRLRERADELRRAELERTLSHLDHLSAEDREQIDRLTRSLLQKLLHGPTKRLKEAAEDGCEHDVLEAARFLFDLDDRKGKGEP